MTNFKTEMERIEREIEEIKKQKKILRENKGKLVESARWVSYRYLDGKLEGFERAKQQILIDMKIVEDAINQLGGAYIIKNKTKEGKLNILIELKEKLGLNHSQQEIQEKGEMYCAQIDEDIGKVCGRVDDTFTAYCIKHGRSVHKIKNVGGIKNEK